MPAVIIAGILIDKKYPAVGLKSMIERKAIACEPHLVYDL